MRKRRAPETAQAQGAAQERVDAVTDLCLKSLHRNREAAQEPPAPPDDPQDDPPIKTVAELIHWLDAKYARHKEIEDYDSARLIEWYGKRCAWYMDALETQRGEIRRFQGNERVAARERDVLRGESDHWELAAGQAEADLRAARAEIAEYEQEITAARDAVRLCATHAGELESLQADARAARQALADAASELPQCAGPIAERIRVYRQSYEEKITAARDLAAQLSLDAERYRTLRAAPAFFDTGSWAGTADQLDFALDMHAKESRAAMPKDSNG